VSEFEALGRAGRGHQAAVDPVKITQPASATPWAAAHGMQPDGVDRYHLSSVGYRSRCSCHGQTRCLFLVHR
jgi:hypothetical protein